MRTLGIFLLLLFLLPSGAHAALSVTLRPEAQVHQSLVTVGDIATVAGPEAQAAPVRALVVASAPALGASRPLRREQVAWQLAQHGVKGAALSGPSVVTISRVVRTLAPAELDAAAQDSLRQAAGESGALLELTLVSPLPAVTVPEGPVEVSAKPAGASLGALRSVTLTVSAEGRVVRTLTARYRLRLEVETPTAVRALRPGEPLEAACWALQQTDVAAVPGRPLTAEELVGRRVRRTVPAGAPLTTENTEPTPLVLKGSTVAVTVRIGGVVLSFEAVARQDGGAGQSIELLNPAAKQTFHATITGPAQAEIAG